MQFKQAKLTKVKPHCHELMYLANMYKENENKFHVKSLYTANILKKEQQKERVADDMFRQASHGELIQQEDL